MARLQRADIVDRVRRWMDVKASPALDTVAPEIMPVLIVGDVQRPESEGGDVRTAMGFGIQAAAASNYAHTQLYNPANSGRELVLKDVYCRLSTAGGISIAVYPTAITTAATTARYRDNPTKRRLADMPAELEPVGVVRTQNHTALYGDRFANIYCGTTESFALRGLDIRIVPSNGILVRADTSNVTLTVTYLWEEMRVR